MVTVTLTESTYERLKAKAAARGVSMDAYLSELAQQGWPGPGDSAKQLAALESFVEGMTAWTSAHLPPGHVTDDVSY